MDKISIIVPIYNSEKYLSKCVDSLLAQTYENIEIILINDGSKDNSKAICDQYKEADDRIVVIHQENAGVAAARNHGLKAATGQWVCFLDSDDWLDPNTFQFAIEKQKEHDVDLVGWNRSEDWPDHRVLCRFADDQILVKSEKEMKKFRYRAFTCQTEKGVHEIGTCNVVARIIRKSLIDDHHLCFPEELRNNEDIIFMLQVFEYVRSVYMENRFFYHRTMHEESAIAKYNPRICANSKLTSKYYFRFLDQYHKPKKYYEFCGGLHVFWALQCFRLGIFHKDNKLSFLKKLKMYRELLTNDPYKTVFSKKPGAVAGIKKVYFFLAKHQMILSCTLFSALYWKVKK